MPLVLYNTKAREKQELVPREPGRVGMYVCGPTVYDRAHIGNARPEIVFDVLYRLLTHVYGEDNVTYVRNITDVDDKINAAAKANDEPIEALTARTTKMFHEDMAALGALPPTHEPRATQFIPQMIAMVETLLMRGHAYEAEGHVLFHVATMEDYGALSGRNLDDMIAGARVEVAPYKKDPADFLLWKPSTPDLPGWDSPWGRGRPGWHLECSVMSEHHLGKTFDIHGGGQDLVFPHHENERAQSLCAHPGEGFAQCWVHNGFVIVEGEKMSKSLGNILTVHDLLERFPSKKIGGEIIRFALLTAHYRQPLDWTESRVRMATNRLNRYYNVLWQFRDEEKIANIGAPPEFIDALQNDLNTAQAIAVLNSMVTKFYKLAGSRERAGLKSQLLACGELLGIFRCTAEEWRKQRSEDLRQWERRGLSVDAAAAKIERLLKEEEEIDERIAARRAARKAKDFATADRIRDELAAQGVILEDRPDGTTDWRRAG